MSRSGLGRTLAATVAATVLAATPLFAAPVATAAPTIRTSATAVWPALMCPSCHEPLALAQSPQAIQERQYVQLLVNKGYTRQQIVNIMVTQYGTTVLAKPPATGFNLAVYILPPALLAAGIAFLLYSLPRWRARARKAATEPMAAGGALPLTAEDAERLDTDLAAFDRK
jgi:cytochrome c-type biogenesis protein CcmH